VIYPFEAPSQDLTRRSRDSLAPHGAWVVLRTHPRREVSAANAIAARGVETFVPLLPPDASSGRRLPLFPGYLFARPEPGTDDLLRIRSLPGIAYVLPRGGLAALLPGTVISLLQGRLDEPRGKLAPGDRVVILAEPFRSLEAIFDHRLSSDGRVQVLIELVHRVVRLNLDERALSRAGDSPRLANGWEDA
jgi:transcription antitermination factor NusG